MRFGLREFVFLLVLMAAPISSFWFVFRPQNSEIAQAKKEIEHKERILEKLSKATSQTADLEQANDEIRNAIGRIESRLPSDKEVDVILEQIAQIATENNLRLTKVRSGKPVMAAMYMEQPLELKVEGKFERFYSFLLDVEKLERITRAPNMTLKRSGEMDGDIVAEFTLSIFFEAGKRSGAST